MKKETLIIKGGDYTGERALFMTHNAVIEDALFHDGESPLKESSDLKLNNVTFQWKYPLWYGNNIEVNNSKILETARSGIWYTTHLTMNNCVIDGPKYFRRAGFITLNNCELNHGEETFWGAHDVKLNNVTVKGNYFLMNVTNAEIDNMQVDGDYLLDGAKNVTIKNCILNSKDSFWNTENVTVINCKIVGEYLAWNSKNITFIDCEISSLQGLCYIQGLKMINCKLLDTNLCFEYCEDIDADIIDEIDSVKNPTSGVIRCPGVKELIIDKNTRDLNKAFKLEIKK